MQMLQRSIRAIVGSLQGILRPRVFGGVAREPWGDDSYLGDSDFDGDSFRLSLSAHDMATLLKMLARFRRNEINGGTEILEKMLSRNFGVSEMFLETPESCEELAEAFEEEEKVSAELPRH